MSKQFENIRLYDDDDFYMEDEQGNQTDYDSELAADMFADLVRKPIEKIFEERAIVVVGMAQSWNGKSRGGKMVETFDEVFATLESCERTVWTITKDGLEVEGHHHDGTNHYLFRPLSARGQEWYQENNWRDRETICEKLCKAPYTTSMKKYLKLFGF